MIGRLAYRAYDDWGRRQGMTALPSQEETDFPPAERDRADELLTHLSQAMIAAAKADGHVTAEERERIDGQLANRWLEDEAATLVAAELDAPLDARRISALATSAAAAAQIYAAALLSVDPESAAEKGYVAMLAARLNLDPALVGRLHMQAAQL